MSKATKKWLTAAASLIGIGAILFAAAMAAYRWDFSRLSTDHPETNTYEIEEGFSGIQLNTKTADILFAVSDDGTCRVVCYEDRKVKHAVCVQDDALTIRVVDSREWYEHIGISFHSPKVTIYLPETEYASLVIEASTGNVTLPREITFGCAAVSLSTGDVVLSCAVSNSARVETSTGDITVADTTAGELTLSASTGEITVSDVVCAGDIHTRTTTGDVNVLRVTCRNFLSSGSTSDISLKELIAKGNLSVERSTGDVKFVRSDAAEICVKTSTGNVTGSILTEKIYIAKASTGKVNVPKTTAGGKCEITTSTGDIRIEQAKDVPS